MKDSIFKRWGQSINQLKNRLFKKSNSIMDCDSIHHSGKVVVDLTEEEKMQTPLVKRQVLNHNKQFTSPSMTTKFIGRKRIPRGQQLYKMNLKTFHVSLVDLQYNDVDFNKDRTIQLRKHMIMEPDHIYDHALNHRNARRRFLRTMRKMLQNVDLKPAF